MVGHSAETGPDQSIPQRERTLAIVLGASEWPSYPDFPTAPSFRRSAQEIADYLLSRNGLGLSPRNVKVLIDSFDDAPEILRQMRDFIRHRRDDLRRLGTPTTDLLLYYVGHGGFADGDAFFLAIRSTEEDDPLATSITAESVGRMIREGAAGLRTYLVLDCCFAASVSKVFMSGGPLGVAGTQLQDALPPQGDAAAIQRGKLPEYGTALLCASGSREPAKAPAGLPYTMFTGGVLEVLRKGDPSAPVWLSLDDMQRLVRARLAEQFADKAVLPQVHAPQQRMGRVDLVPLFRNLARHAPESRSLQVEKPGDYSATGSQPAAPLRRFPGSDFPSEVAQPEMRAPRLAIGQGLPQVRESRLPHEREGRSFLDWEAAQDNKRKVLHQKTEWRWPRVTIWIAPFVIVGLALFANITWVSHPSLPEPAPAGPPQAATSVTIRSSRMGEALCMDVAGGLTPAPGQSVVGWHCHGDKNQRWIINRIDQRQSRLIGPGGMCLDLRAGRVQSEAQLVIWQCNSGDSQRFLVGGDGTIQQVQTGKCLIANYPPEGAQITLGACTGGAGVRWEFR